MDSKRFAIATLVGAIVLYAVGYVMFTRALGPFYEANVGSATGVTRTPEILWAGLIGNLAYAALIAYVLANRAGPLSIADGFKVGAIVGFLMWLTADFIFYSSTNLANLTRTIVDPLLEIVHGGAGGAAIAAIAGRATASARASA